MAAHIMAVDDDPLIRRLVQMNLQRQGYRVTLASNGVEALQQLEDERPDLLVLDISMPEMDGIELLRRLRAAPDTADIRVIMLSAKAQEADIHEGHRSGANAYLTKPFSPQALIETVQEVLSQS